MSTINLLDALSKLLNCEIVALHDYMNHPLTGNKINELLKDKNIRTTYINRATEQKIVKFGGFSQKPACQQSAYEGYLGVSVQQHFYCRHRIRLMYPRLRCIIEYGKSGHNKYYPLELLEFFTDDNTTVKDSTVYLETPLENKNADIYSPLSGQISDTGSKNLWDKSDSKHNEGKLVIDESNWSFTDPNVQTSQQQSNLVDTLSPCSRRPSWYTCYYGH